VSGSGQAQRTHQRPALAWRPLVVTLPATRGFGVIVIREKPPPPAPERADPLPKAVARRLAERRAARRLGGAFEPEASSRVIN
jgi:hypothetical protein